MSKETKVMDRSEELVEVYIPKTNKTDTQRFVSVNGDNVLVQTGVRVAIKRKFAEVIDNSLIAEREADDYISGNSN